MGKLNYFMKTIGVFVFMIFSLASCSNGKSMIIVDAPTKVYKEYPEGGLPSQDKVVSVLNKDEVGDVLQVRYSKDFMYYKIRLKDGREGYVLFGDKFRVVPKNKITH